MKREGFSFGLFFILTFLPLLLLYYGWKFVRERETGWEDAKQKVQARQMLDSLSTGWKIQDQLERIADSLYWKLERDIPDTEMVPRDFLATVSSVLKVFPDNELWVFRFESPTDSKSFSAIRVPNQGSGQRFCLLAFQTLVIMASGSKEEGESRPAKTSPSGRFAGTPPSMDGRRGGFGKKALESLFGQNIPSELLAREQRGKATRVLYKKSFRWLVWDFVKIKGKPGLGFFLLVKDDKESRRGAMQLAAISGKKRVSKTLTGGSLRGIDLSRKIRNSSAGFLRLYTSDVGDVIPLKLSRSRSFREWLKRWRKNRSLKSLQQAGLETDPWQTRIDDWKLFTGLIPNSSHVGMVLLPLVRPKGPPVFLKLLILVFAAGWLSMLILRLLKGNSARIPMVVRFIAFYSLAALLPVCLAEVSFDAYIRESRATLIRNIRTRLQHELLKADGEGQNLLVGYQAAFNSMINNEDVIRCLRNRGLGDPLLLRTAREKFLSAGRELPFESMHFFDCFGNEIATYAAEPASNLSNPVLHFYKICLISALREKFSRREGNLPPGKNPISPEDDGLIKGYLSLSSITTVTEEVEERRGKVELAALGKYKLYKCQNFIPVGGKEMFSALVLWTLRGLERNLFRKIKSDFQSRNPEDRIFVFQKIRGRLVPLGPPFREGIKLAGMLSHSSRFTPVGEELKEGIFLSMEFSSIPNTIIGAYGNTEEAEKKLVQIHLFRSILIVVMLFVIAILGIASWIRVGTPISAVNSGLSAVETGDFSRRVGLSRPDEFGLLTETFDHMIQKLEIRKRFAALVSGKALDALVANENLERAIAGKRCRVAILVSDIRSFTTLCETFPPTQITEMLNEHFEKMSDAINEFGGRVDRFIGDAIVAVFEEPFSHGEEAPVKAGMEMLQRLSAINVKREELGSFTYKIGVGLTIGEVVMGGVGDPDVRFDFAVMGPPLKRAAWLESLSKAAPHFPLVVDAPTREGTGKICDSMIPLEGHGNGAFVFPPAEDR